MDNAPAKAPEAPPQPRFLYIPIERLIIMDVIATGWFEFYWMYLNWREQRRLGEKAFSPFWRTVLGLYYVYHLFKAVHRDPELGRGREPSYSPGLLAAAWVLLLAVSVGMMIYDNAAVRLVGLNLFLLKYLCFIPVQLHVNRHNDEREPKPEYLDWTAGQAVLLLVGIITWLVYLF